MLNLVLIMKWSFTDHHMIASIKVIPVISLKYSSFVGTLIALKPRTVAWLFVFIAQISEMKGTMKRLHSIYYRDHNGKPLYYLSEKQNEFILKW